MKLPIAPAPRRAWAGLAIATLVASSSAQNPPARPRSFAVTGVRLEVAEDAPTHTLILRDGRIAAIHDSGGEVPADTWIVDGSGLVAVPAFVDAWTELGVEGEDPAAEQDRPVDESADVRIDMRQANRTGVRPTFQAADALKPEDDEVRAWREHGFGLALAAPDDLLLAGTSAVVALRPAAPRDLVVRGEVFQHAEFRAPRGGYPRTLMGYHAQLRQFFLDADHHRTLRERWKANRPGPRPSWDADLEEGAALLDGAPLVCAADTARDVNRWLRLADEIGLNVAAFAGGRDAWKVADELAKREIAVILDLDWGDEVPIPEEDVPGEDAPEEPPAEQAEDEPEQTMQAEEDAEIAEEAEPEEETASSAYDYREPLGVRREKRRLWEERRDGALRLHEAGVRVLFGTGDRKAKELLDGVRTLVEAGLPREVALEALTAHPARFLGVGRQHGVLRPGAAATFTLWTGDPLAEDSQAAWSFVDGFAQEFELEEEGEGETEEPADGVDLSGTWRVTSGDDDERPTTLTLTMTDDGEVEGSAVTTSPVDGSKLTAEVTGRVSGDEVSLSMTFQVASMEVEVELEGTVEDDRMSGTRTLRLPGNEQHDDFEATRQPGDIR